MSLNRLNRLRGNAYVDGGWRLASGWRREERLVLTKIIVGCRSRGRTRAAQLVLDPLSQSPNLFW
jgi:hypothetical protein